MGFSRQEYWSGLPFPPPGAFPNRGFSCTAGRLFTVWATREASHHHREQKKLVPSSPIFNWLQFESLCFWSLHLHFTRLQVYPAFYKQTCLLFEEGPYLGRTCRYKGVFLWQSPDWESSHIVICRHCSNMLANIQGWFRHKSGSHSSQEQNILNIQW